MGQFLLILAVWGVIVLYRLFSLTGDCYEHVKEHIRADQHAGHRTIRSQERALRRRKPLPDANARGMYQPTAITPAGAARHVRLLLDPLFIVMPSRRNVRGAVIHWTPLVSYPTSEWLDELGGRVAHFLGVREHEVELDDVNTYRKRIKIVRTS
ncbi:MAG TPA: hypothetical protein VE776_11845 [Actinomycetota bacterium]|jgi:hypothetical protein|nr:hypothetical protein [Actinomycetota bacterium]